MKRNLYDGGHRRPDAEPSIPQGGTVASRSPQPRYRTTHQRRDLYSTTEQRSLGSPYSVPPDRSRRNGGTDRDEQLRIENERHQESERERLRNELLELARDLKAMRKLTIGRIDVAGAPSAKMNPDFASDPAPFKKAAYDLPPSRAHVGGSSAGLERSRTLDSGATTHPYAVLRSGEPSSGSGRKIQTPSDSSEASGEPAPLRNRPIWLHSQTPERPHQPIADPSQQNLQAGIIDTKGDAASVRVQTPPLAGAPGVRKSVKDPTTRSRGIRLRLAAEVVSVILLMLVGAALITPKLWDEMPQLTPVRQKIADILAHVSRPAVKAAPIANPVITPVAHTTPIFGVPDTYGVYAISNGKLIALEQLPIRVPDARVSISSTISKPAPAPFANGHLSFVAYHRDLATSVPESASVRIVAKVIQATTYAGGTPKATAVEETWAVRGGAINLRIAPVPENREMVVIRAADPNFTLSPGRYVLMFKNQAYDFSVAGKVTDPAHCLERSDLQDRSVYSECRELPAQQASF